LTRIRPRRSSANEESRRCGAGPSEENGSGSRPGARQAGCRGTPCPRNGDDLGDSDLSHPLGHPGSRAGFVAVNKIRDVVYYPNPAISAEASLSGAKSGAERRSVRQGIRFQWEPAGTTQSATPQTGSMEPKRQTKTQHRPDDALRHNGEHGSLSQIADTRSARRPPGSPSDDEAPGQTSGSGSGRDEPPGPPR